MKKPFLILSTLLILFAGGCSKEDSDKKFTCELESKTTILHLVTGEKEIRESQITWMVIVNIPKKIFTWGIDGSRSGCHPLNENELTIESSYLHCQEKLLGGEASKKQEIKNEYGETTFLDYPEKATFNRYSLRFTQNTKSQHVGAMKGSTKGYGADMNFEKTGICKEVKKKL